MQNVVAVLFRNESEGYQAITEFRNAPVTEKYAILQAALIKRQGGELTVCDSFDSRIQKSEKVVTGGLMGSLLGILGGPIGVILMGSYGALAGSLAGQADTAEGAAMLEIVAGKLLDGETAMVALVDEAEEVDLDEKLVKFNDIEIARFDAAVVAAELEEAEKMQLEMLRQTRRQLREVKFGPQKKAIEEKRAVLDEDFATFKQQFNI